MIELSNFFIFKLCFFGGVGLVLGCVVSLIILLVLGVIVSTIMTGFNKNG